MGLIVLKMIVVATVLLAGLALIWKGVGGFSDVTGKGFSGKNLPTGLLVMGLGVALAVFWKVEDKTETTTIVEEVKSTPATPGAAGTTKVRTETRKVRRPRGSHSD